MGTRTSQQVPAGSHSEATQLCPGPPRSTYDRRVSLTQQSLGAPWMCCGGRCSTTARGMSSTLRVRRLGRALGAVVAQEAVRRSDGVRVVSSIPPMGSAHIFRFHNISFLLVLFILFLGAHSTRRTERTHGALTSRRKLRPRHSPVGLRPARRDPARSVEASHQIEMSDAGPSRHSY